MTILFLLFSCSAQTDGGSARASGPQHNASLDAGFLVLLDAAAPEPGVVEPSLDAGVSEDAGAGLGLPFHVPEIPVPERPAPVPSAGPEPESVPPEPSSMPLEPSPVPGTAEPDAGSLLPAELTEHATYLESSGFAPCDILTDAVLDCCHERAGSAFVCAGDSCDCEGTQTEYPSVAALCIIAPATPLRWECP